MFYAMNSIEIVLADALMHNLAALLTAAGTPLPAGTTRVQIQNKGAAQGYVGTSATAVGPAKTSCMELVQYAVINIDGADRIWVGADAAQSMVCIPYIGSAGN